MGIYKILSHWYLHVRNNGIIKRSEAILKGPTTYTFIEDTSRKQIRVTNTPLHPTFIIGKLGFTGVYVFSYFAPKHNLCTHNQCLSKTKKNIKKIHLKMNIFTAVKYCCILHGRVCIIAQLFKHYNAISRGANIDYCCIDM